MTLTPENIVFMGAILVFASIFISKWGYRFGIPTLLLFLFTGLDRYWKESKQEYFEVGNRHRSMLIIAGTLCKAGIPQNKATDYLTENYPEKDILEIGGVIQYAYDNNAFGCDRRRYR